jgi:Uncharacterised protein conserved in bacteria (DUF2336)
MKTAVREVHLRKFRSRSWIPQLGLTTGRKKTKTNLDGHMASSPYEKLLELAHQRALKGKGGLAASVAEMCLAAKSSLSKRELDLAFEILRLLVDKVEINIRRHIADYLAERRDVPADLIRRLAMDEIGVAYPILSHNPLLNENDLIDVVADCSLRHRQAVAIRPRITQTVTDRLIAHDEIEVLTTLICNETADIGEASMAHLVERSLDIESFREPLAHRKEMTSDMARRMFIWAGDSLREYIIDEFGVDPASFEVGDTAATAPAMSMSDAFVAFLDAGDVDGFEQAFADALQLPLPAISMILHDSAPETVAIAARAVDVEEHVFGRILRQVMGSDRSVDVTASKEYQRALRYFGQLDCAGAIALLDRLRVSTGHRRRA